MVFEKIHEIILFRQNKWLEKKLNFNAQNRNKAKNEFEKDFYNLLNNAFCGKTMEKVRSRLWLELLRKGNSKIIIIRQPN